MRLWLAGSRSFGHEVFCVLSALWNTEIVGVTAPNESDALSRVAVSAGIIVTSDLDSAVLVEEKPDLIVSAQNYAHISAEARAAAKYGAIGYHPSLLPRHRGRSAVEWTVAMRDAIAGGTVYLMDDGWDTGPIIAQRACHVVPGWSPSDLWRERLFSLGVTLLHSVIVSADPQHLEIHGVPWVLVHQDEQCATTEPTWTAEHDRKWRGVEDAR